jgi:hypothetical protein
MSTTIVRPSASGDGEIMWSDVTRSMQLLLPTATEMLRDASGKPCTEVYEEISTLERQRWRHITHLISARPKPLPNIHPEFLVSGQDHPVQAELTQRGQQIEESQDSDVT